MLPVRQTPQRRRSETPASAHPHAIDSAVGNLHRHNLRLESREWRKTNCLELDLFTLKKLLAQITQGDCEAESGKRLAGFNINFFAHIFVVFADVRAGDS